jgi:hypothetical protein
MSTVTADPATNPAAIIEAAYRARGVPGRPLKPCAKVVRAALRAAGMEDYVERVGTGSRVCSVTLHWVNDEDSGGTEQQRRAHAVRDTLRLLWSDGADRVYTGEYYHGSVKVFQNIPASWADTAAMDAVSR